MKNKNLLLMRGLIREGRHWGDFPEQLQSALGNYQVSTLDIPGNGQWHSLRSFTSIRQNVLFLRDQWRKKTDYPGENVIVGMSLGGMIAMEWTSLFPEDWNKAILINSSHGALSPFYHRLKPSNLPKLLNYVLTHKQEIIYDLTVNDAKDRKKVIDLWTEIARTKPVKASNALRQVWSALKYRQIQNHAPIPYYILASKADRLVNFECSERISKHWNCPISYNDQSGHDPSIDSPDWLVSEIKKYLKD